MSNIILPTTKRKPTTLNPRILTLYSLPKIGKTTILSQLDGCLILDLDIPKGTSFIECLAIEINNIYDFQETLKKLKEIWTSGEYPYKYIAIDTISQLEKWSIPRATEEWKKSNLYSPTKQGHIQNVLELPEGAGYYWLRKVFFSYIEYISSFCDKLILIGHVNLADINKDTKNVNADEIALLGKSKLGTTSISDATGYLYRDEIDDSKLMITFKSVGHTSSGARCHHLYGKKFEFSWDKIYLNENENEKPTSQVDL
jgi:AAA domain